MSGSGPIYEYQRELTAKLEVMRRERDEARAEVERLRASVENLDALYISRTDALRECEAALRTVAEAQREACAERFYADAMADFILATPLVTEGDK